MSGSEGRANPKEPSVSNSTHLPPIGAQLSLFGQGDGEISDGRELTPGSVDNSQFPHDISDAPPCVACGLLMKPSGTCDTCVNCGQTSGCS